MSTELRKQQSEKKGSSNDGKGLRIGIVTARWNSEFTEAMLNSATRTLNERGCSDIFVERVPGAIELTYGANMMIESYVVDAVIVFGCVIRGGTPHFDYVCQSVTQGVTTLNAEGTTPVIFGVLTVDNEQQARERVDGSLADKGAEAAEAAIEMALLRIKFETADDENY